MRIHQIVHGHEVETRREFVPKQQFRDFLKEVARRVEEKEKQGQPPVPQPAVPTAWQYQQVEHERKQGKKAGNRGRAHPDGQGRQYFGQRKGQVGEFAVGQYRKLHKFHKKIDQGKRQQTSQQIADGVPYGAHGGISLEEGLKAGRAF